MPRPHLGWLPLLAAASLMLCSCTTTVSPLGGHPALGDNPPAFDSDKEGRTRLRDMPPERLLAAGETQLAAANFPVARLYFSMALQKKPRSPEALVGLGRTYMREGDFQKAKGFYARALEEDPDNVSALLASARCERNLGQDGNALELLERALHEDEKNIDVLTELGITCDQRGERIKAREYYLRVIQHAPDQPHGYNNLGFNYMLEKSYSEAISAFSRAATLDPRNKRTLNNLASAHALSGSEDKAIELFTTTVGKAEAFNNLGYLYLTVGRYNDAEKALKRAIELKPTYYEKAQVNLERLARLREKPTSRQ